MGHRFGHIEATETDHVRESAGRYGNPALRLGDTVRVRYRSDCYAVVEKLWVANDRPPTALVRLLSTADGRPFRKRRTRHVACCYLTLATPYIRDGAEPVV